MPDFEQMLRDRLMQLRGASPVVAGAQALGAPAAAPAMPASLAASAPPPVPAMLPETPTPPPTAHDINLPKDPPLLDGNSPEIVHANIETLKRAGVPEGMAIRAAQMRAKAPPTLPTP